MLYYTENHSIFLFNISKVSLYQKKKQDWQKQLKFVIFKISIETNHLRTICEIKK